MSDNEILFKFLGSRARRFVERVRSEWALYLHPWAQARPGCIRRDAVRFRLERLAYYRYSKTI